MSIIHHHLRSQDGRLVSPLYISSLTRARIEFQFITRSYAIVRSMIMNPVYLLPKAWRIRSIQATVVYCVILGTQEVTCMIN